MPVSAVLLCVGVYEGIPGEEQLTDSHRSVQVGSVPPWLRKHTTASTADRRQHGSGMWREECGACLKLSVHFHTLVCTPGQLLLKQEVRSDCQFEDSLNLHVCVEVVQYSRCKEIRMGKMMNREPLLCHHLLPRHSSSNLKFTFSTAMSLCFKLVKHRNQYSLCVCLIYILVRQFTSARLL